MPRTRLSNALIAAIVGSSCLPFAPAWAKVAPPGQDDMSVYDYGYWNSATAPAAGPDRQAAPPGSGGPGPSNVATTQSKEPEAGTINFHAGETHGYTPTMTAKADDDGHTPGTGSIPTAFAGPCRAGAPCGWTSAQQTWSSQDVLKQSSGYRSGGSETVLAPFRLQGIAPPDPDQEAGAGPVAAAGFVVSAPVLNHAESTKISSLPLSGHYWLGWNEYHWPAAVTDTNVPLAHSDLYGADTSKAPADSHFSELGADFVVQPWAVDIALGTWRDGHQSNSGGSQAITTNQGDFVTGTTSSQAALDRLNSGKVTVDYEGCTVIGGTPMTASLDFGRGKWRASFNNGRDDAGVAVDSVSGNLSGNIGFNAQGHIAGPNLITDSLSATDGTINKGRSTLEGAVFGNGAQIVAGGYEVVKTRSDGTYSNGRTTDVFIGLNKASRP